MSKTISQLKAYRSAILHFTDSPKSNNDKHCYQYWEDGILITENGLIQSVGPAKDLLQSTTHMPLQTFTNTLIMPGFIDTHTHYPQMGKIAAYGENLLNWLNKHIFLEEAKFENATYADTVAHRFLDTLLEYGTTTAMIFCTIHTTSVDAIFQAAAQRNMRIIAGKVMMDHQPYAPACLSDTAESSYQQSQALIDKWHNQGRASYAVTPRFAPTSTKHQLNLAGQLLKQNPSVYLQTHISESIEEIELVKKLFPDSKDYLDVYESAGLVSDHSMFAHAIHLSDQEWQRLGQANAAVSSCPSSNFYLGSGIPNMKKAEDNQVKVSLGTDIGAGTNFSMLSTLNSAYQADHLHGHATCPLKSFYLATLGGAKALNLEHEIGSFRKGNAADFVVLDCTQPKLLGQLYKTSSSLLEKLSILRTLGDDRTIKQTYVMGEMVNNNQFSAK